MLIIESVSFIQEWIKILKILKIAIIYLVVYKYFSVFSKKIEIIIKPVGKLVCTTVHY